MVVSATPRVTATHIIKLSADLLADTVTATERPSDIYRDGALLYIRLIRRELDELEGLLTAKQAEAA